MPRRIVQFVALFMLAFALFDVCSPEDCAAQVPSSAQSTSKVQVQHDSDGPDSCQFEEDCFNCAHFAPGTTFSFEPIAMVSHTESDLLVPPLDGTPLIPYHPPRA